MKKSFKKGFYPIENYSNYSVNKKGVVKNLKTGKILLGSINYAGYHNYRLTDDSGHTLTWGRHRLLCYVFKPCDFMQKKVVNHKNHIKGDDRLSNLEWLTQKQNIEFSGNKGIGSCYPIFVKCSVSGVITKYHSVTEAGRIIGLSKDAVLYRISKGPQHVFPEYKQYKLVGDNRIWGDIDDIYYKVLNNGTCKKIEAKHFFTKNTSTFNSISELASFINYSPSTITGWFKKSKQPFSLNFYQLKFITNKDPWEEITDPYLKLESFHNIKCVVCENMFNGNIDIFMSAKECAEKNNIKATCLSYRLKYENVVWEDNKKYFYYNKM